MNSFFLGIRHHAKSIAAILVTVASLAAAVVTLIPFNGSNAAVTYEILETIDVLDVRAPLQGLEITFQGEDIEQENLNLRIYAMRVRNTGNINILQNHFDNEIPWGLQIANGKVIEARLTGASTDYLEDQSAPQIVNEDFLQFKKVIFEKNQSFTFTILVLHTKEIPPELLAVGKIAGIDEIRIVSEPIEEAQTGVISEAIGGSWWVQSVRIVLVPLIAIGALVLLMLIFLLVIYLIEIPENRKMGIRRGKVGDILSLQGIGNSSTQAVFKQEYVENGPDGLRKLRDQMKSLKSIAGTQRVVRYDTPVEDTQEGDLIHHPSQLYKYSLNWLVEIGAVKPLRKQRLTINPDFVADLDKVIDEVAYESDR